MELNKDMKGLEGLVSEVRPKLNQAFQEINFSMSNKQMALALLLS